MNTEATTLYKLMVLYMLSKVNFPLSNSQIADFMLDKQYIFTGDLLMKDNPTITRFPGGKTKDFQNITIPFLHTLNKEITVLPGHGDIFQLKEKMIEGHLNVAIR